MKIFSTFYFINRTYPYNKYRRIQLTVAGEKKDEPCFPLATGAFRANYNEKLEGYREDFYGLSNKVRSCVKIFSTFAIYPRAALTRPQGRDR